MQTIEQVAALHREIGRNAPHPGGLFQHVAVLSGWASNMEDQSLVFTSRIAPGEVADPDERNSLLQGFGCVEVNLTAKWGGYHHEGALRTKTEITVHVLDRLAGGMARQTWHTYAIFGSTAITVDELLPLLRKLLGQEPLETLLARKSAEIERQAAEMKALRDQLGL
jgi:hypothetical protein